MKLDINYWQGLAKYLNDNVLPFYQKQANEIASVHKLFVEQFTKVNRINFSIPNFYTDLPQINRRTLSNVLNVSNQITQIVEANRVLEISTTTKIREITQNLDVNLKRITADFVVTRLSIESLLVSDLFKDLMKLVHENVEAVDAFQIAGWPVAPSMSRELKNRVARMHNEGKARYISRVIMGYYQRNNHLNLRNMVKSWEANPLFVPRMPIFRDALEAHVNSLYTLSVPALVPQIEGVLNEYVIFNGLTGKAKFGKIEQVYKAVVGDPDSHSFSTWAIARTLLYLLQTNTYVYTPFDDELKKSIRTRRTSRHTLLHGVAVNYSKPMNSLRAFLILDAISALNKIEDES